jgi:hypothetical protein
MPPGGDRDAAGRAAMILPVDPRSSPHRMLAAALVLGLVVAGCSDDGDDASDDDVVDTTLAEGVGSDLVTEGEMTCEDVQGDVSMAAETLAPPPVPTPGVDVLSVDATLDDEFFTATFNLADPPDVETDPEYLVLVGYPEDVTGFEVQLQHGDGVWVAELVQRTADIGDQRTALVNATVTAADDRIIATIPTAALPPISVSQPVFFGSSALMLDDGELVDREGEAITTTTEGGSSPTTASETTTTTAMVQPPAGVRAIDDCTQFGQ